MWDDLDREPYEVAFSNVGSIGPYRSARRRWRIGRHGRREQQTDEQNRDHTCPAATASSTWLSGTDPHRPQHTPTRLDALGTGQIARYHSP
jgi:hypothetical protein